jgi:hypothetical protein
MFSYHRLPPVASEQLCAGDYFAIFETNRFGPLNRHSYLFFDPVDMLQFAGPGNPHDFFDQLEDHAHDYFLAGFMSYELGYLFESCLPRDIMPSRLSSSRRTHPQRAIRSPTCGR